MLKKFGENREFVTRENWV